MPEAIPTHNLIDYYATLKKYKKNIILATHGNLGTSKSSTLLG